jgi:SAM-dependent methyltransferase
MGCVAGTSHRNHGRAVKRRGACNLCVFDGPHRIARPAGRGVLGRDRSTRWQDESDRGVSELPRRLCRPSKYSWSRRARRPLHRKPCGGPAVLDLGCGSGRPVAQHMAERGLRVTGIDSSPAMISVCRTRLPDHEWIVADLRALSLRRRFDGVLAWDQYY